MYPTPLGLNVAPLNYWSPCPLLDQALVGTVNVSGGSLYLGVPLDTAVRNWTVIASPDVTQVRVILPNLPTITIRAPGPYTFDAAGTPGHGTVVAISSPTPSQSVVSIVRTDELARFNAGELFTSDFLDVATGASTLRFMDCNYTNQSDPALGTTIMNWTPLSSKTYTQMALPVEITAAMCNKIGAHCWFNIPSTLDLREARRVVEQLRSLLMPWLNIYIEWSNEVWNTAAAFKTGRYAIKQVGGSALYYGTKAAECAKNLYGIPNTSLRLCWKWVAPAQMQQVIDAYKAAGGPWDFVSGLGFAPYAWNDKNPVSFYLPSNSDGLLDELDANRVAMTAKCLPGWVSISQTNGKPLCRYEEALSPFPKLDAENDLCTVALKSPRAGQIMTSLWKDLDAAGAGTGCFYTSAACGVFGFGADYSKEGGYAQRDAFKKYNQLAWPMSRGN